MKRFLVARSMILFSMLAVALVVSGCSGEGEETKPSVLKPYDARQIGKASAPSQQGGPVKLAVATEPLDPSEPAAPGSPAVVPFQRWDMPETAAHALGRIGAAAVPELSLALRDPNPLVRKRAADILARIGPAAKEAVPVLIQTLNDPDEPVRKAAMRALGEIGPEAKDAVPHLIEALREPGKINETR